MFPMVSRLPANGREDQSVFVTKTQQVFHYRNDQWVVIPRDVGENGLYATKRFSLEGHPELQRLAKKDVVDMLYYVEKDRVSCQFFFLLDLDTRVSIWQHIECGGRTEKVRYQGQVSRKGNIVREFNHDDLAMVCWSLQVYLDPHQAAGLPPQRAIKQNMRDTLNPPTPAWYQNLLYYVMSAFA